MIVTSLPIAYRENRPVRVLITPFITSVLSKVINAQAIFPLNLIGLRGHDSSVPQVEIFLRDLTALNLLKKNDVVVTDTQPDIIETSRILVAEALEKKVCEQKEEMVSYCTCGKVEILTRVLESFSSEQFKLVRKNDSIYSCKLCMSLLSVTTQSVLLHKLLNIDPPETFPSIFANRASGIFQQFSGNFYLVSRSHRSSGVSITSNPNFFLDPDFHAGLYLLYLKRKYLDNKIALVVGANHFSRGCRSIAIAKSIDSEIEISLVTHPMYVFDSKNLILDQDITLSDCFKKFDVTTLKFFFVTMLQWRKHLSLCNMNDLNLVQRTVPMLKHYQDDVSSVYIKEAVPSILSRDNCLKLLKKVRNGKDLTSHEILLLRALH